MKAAQLTILLFIFSACGKKAPGTDGTIAFVKGSATIEQLNADGSKKNKPAGVGDKVFVGDTIVTGAGSNIVFNVSGAQMEIQQNSRFVYEQGGEDKIMYLQSGNAWTSVSKMGDKGKFSLRTPTTVAGVRGTKFFTFVVDGMTGTCHCEGKIAFKNTVSGKEEVNDEDYLMFYRGDKAVKVTLADIRKLGIPANHKHSELENGAMGQKNDLTPAHIAKLQTHVAKSFAAIR